MSDKFDEIKYANVTAVKSSNQTVLNEKKEDIDKKTEGSSLSKFAAAIKNGLKNKNLLNFKTVKIASLILVFLIVLFLLFSNTASSTLNGTKNTSANNNLSSSYYTTSLEYASIIEDKLSEILSGISGAGEVSVMVTVGSSYELVIANKTDEKTNSSSNGNNNSSYTTTVSNPIILNDNTPLVVSEILPTIKGVVVVSTGARDALVKYNLIQAVKALLDIPSSNIQIFSSK